MKPSEPGSYMAREIVYGLANTRLASQAHLVEVVAGVPNPRGHHLLVKTGAASPLWRALDCYEWCGTMTAQPPAKDAPPS